MYITKAIDTAKTLRPDEYTVEEYVMWCNELSCDLRMNYDKKYSNTKLSGESEIFLPTGIDIYMIDKIIADGNEIKKTDVYDFANRYVYQERGRGVFKRPSGVSEVEIIYQIPYTPIRFIDTTISVETDSDTFEMDDIGICAGDEVLFTKNSVTYTVVVVSVEDDVYTYDGDTLPTGIFEYGVIRKIKEKTVCPSPFDYMYIDFLIAKSSLYSGDSTAYKNHMAAYKLKLEEYKNWIGRRKNIRDKKWMNWY